MEVENSDKLLHEIPGKFKARGSEVEVSARFVIFCTLERHGSKLACFG